MQARDIIQKLSLQPHPEGGWYREIYRSGLQVEGPRGRRSALTTIYYLLEQAQLSRWHVVDADEVWHFYCGAPLELATYDPDSRSFRRHVLVDPQCQPPLTTPTALFDVNRMADPDGSQPVAVVAAGMWQAARSLGEYSLVGCSVGPGFEFADFRFVASLPGHVAHFAAALQGWQDLL
jgi:uncharacterized protein